MHDQLPNWESVLGSRDEFDAYIAGLRARVFAATRRRFLEEALAALVQQRALLDTEHPDLAAEIDAGVAEARRLLSDGGGADAVPAPAPEPQPPALELVEVEAEPEPAPEPEPALSPEDVEAVRQAVRSALETAASDFDAIRTDSVEQNRAPWVLRATIADMQAARARCAAAGLTAEFAGLLRRTSESARMVIETLGDKTARPPDTLTDAARTGDTSEHVELWHALADRYERCGDADDAWRWWEHNHQALLSTTNEQVRAALFARFAGARLFLDALNVKDPAVNRAVKELDPPAGVIPPTTEKTLDAAGARLDDLIASAKAAIARQAARGDATAARKAAQAKAVHAIKARHEAAPDARASADTAMQDALEEAIGAGVPPSNAEIRDLLLDTGLGESLTRPELAPIRKQVELKFANLQPVVEVAGPTDVDETAPPESYESAVARAAFEGSTITLVGGVPKPDLRSRLANELGATVKWIPVNMHSKSLTKTSDIANADVVVVIINLCSHDATARAIDLAGERVVTVTSLGLKSIVRTLAEYVQTTGVQASGSGPTIRMPAKAGDIRDVVAGKFIPPADAPPAQAPPAKPARKARKK